MTKLARARDLAAGAMRGSECSERSQAGIRSSLLADSAGGALITDMRRRAVTSLTRGPAIVSHALQTNFLLPSSAAAGAPHGASLVDATPRRAPIMAGWSSRAEPSDATLSPLNERFGIVWPTWPRSVLTCFPNPAAPARGASADWPPARRGRNAVCACVGSGLVSTPQPAPRSNPPALPPPALKTRAFYTFPSRRTRHVSLSSLRVCPDRLP